MRYYLATIQHNAEKDAENRTTPKAFDKLEEAIAQFHKQMGADMTNGTLDWAISIVFNSEGGIHRNEKWEREKEEEIFESSFEA